MPERIVILGTGAMACLFAARLAPQSEIVMLGTWKEGLEALRTRGVRLEVNGSCTQVKVHATDQPEEAGPARMALVLLKAYQTRRAAEWLRQCLSGDGVAVTLQNGLGNLEALERELGRERSALGTTTYGATLLGPGQVRSGGEGEIRLARHPRVQPLVKLLQEANMAVRWEEDADSLAWSKAVLNAGINPVTALLGVPNGELRRTVRPAAWEVAARATGEAAAVARARGLTLPYADPLAVLDDVLQRTADNRSSMLQDVERGRPTEVEAINGVIVQEGRAWRVPVPVNETLLDLMRGLSGGGARGAK